MSQSVIRIACSGKLMDTHRRTLWLVYVKDSFIVGVGSYEADIVYKIQI